MREPIDCLCWEEDIDTMPDMIGYGPNAISETFGVYGNYHKISGAVLDISMGEIIHRKRPDSIEYMCFRDIPFETLVRIHRSSSCRNMETLLGIDYEYEEEIY